MAPEQECSSLNRKLQKGRELRQLFRREGGSPKRQETQPTSPTPLALTDETGCGTVAGSLVVDVLHLGRRRCSQWREISRYNHTRGTQGACLCTPLVNVNVQCSSRFRVWYSVERLSIRMLTQDMTFVPAALPPTCNLRLCILNLRLSSSGTVKWLIVEVSRPDERKYPVKPAKKAN
jgi:hypothetical protein